ncbi:MAG: MBOAT family protein [Lactobacillales bacterium]|nr:MBOAT family protein [Lactobacillales bacterium]
MLFNSYIFVLLFLPLCLIGYFILNYFKKYKLAQYFVLGMSFWFYGYFNYYYLIIIIFSILFNYGIYCLFKKIEKNNKRKILLIFSILMNLGLLFYFKYYDFFISNINNLFNLNFTLKNIVLPLGISFFTFQQLSFVIDAYKKEVPGYSLINYATFVTFFPQLIAGPIVTHDELVPQFMDKEKKKINWDNMARGIYIFVLGLAKKVLIADIFGNAVNYGFSNIELLDSTSAIIVMLSYTIQIYFDFSGYCDMAIGIGKMMNIDLPINFNSPYKSINIIEFWKRWHITLTRFFTKYIYIPLGGSKKGKIKTYTNIMIIFLISGFWHGANWTFVLWGLLHGIFSVITRCFKKFFDRIHPILNWLITFIFINFTWIIFRANSIKEAFNFINKIFDLNFKNINKNIVDCFNSVEFTFITSRISILKIYPNFLLICYFIFTIILILFSKNAFEKMKKFQPNFCNVTCISILLIWCILSFSGISTFLYFNF